MTGVWSSEQSRIFAKITLIESMAIGCLFGFFAFLQTYSIVDLFFLWFAAFIFCYIVIYGVLKIFAPLIIKGLNKYGKTSLKSYVLVGIVAAIIVCGLMLGGYFYKYGFSKDLLDRVTIESEMFYIVFAPFFVSLTAPILYWCMVEKDKTIKN